MTDASSEKRGWLSRLTQGLTRTSQTDDRAGRLGVHQGQALDQDMPWIELEDLLIEADLGPRGGRPGGRGVRAWTVSGARRPKTEIKESLAEAIAAELIAPPGAVRAAEPVRTSPMWCCSSA